MPTDLIARNLEQIEESLRQSCRKAGRARDSVTVVAVSKTFPAEAVARAIALGIADIGENRVQELREKRTLVPSSARWHLIGHLQSNKVREASRIADVIQTIDSQALAEKISRECGMIDRTIRVLIQVNVGREAQKSGVDPEGVDELVRSIGQLPHLRLSGLMAIPPLDSDPRPYFSALRSLRDSVREKLQMDSFEELSMGMSEDFPIAIEEGATMIRLGRRLFGDRSA